MFVRVLKDQFSSSFFPLYGFKKLPDLLLIKSKIVLNNKKISTIPRKYLVCIKVRDCLFHEYHTLLPNSVL